MAEPAIKQAPKNQLQADLVLSIAEKIFDKEFNQFIDLMKETTKDDFAQLLDQSVKGISTPGAGQLIEGATE